MEMKKYKLGEIANYVTDKINSSQISLSDYVTTDCILQNKKGRECAVNLPPKTCSLTKYKKGDILLANIRPYLQKIWFADSEGGASSDVLVLRAKENISSQFLFSVLLQDSFFTYVMKGAKGSKMPRGDKAQIMEFNIPYYDLPTQQRIAKVLTDIDNKIALNKKINKELEAMAKELYDYWFVQFDYPNENGKPYKSSGGKMVYNEVLKREIPEGWEDGTLSDIANITMGQSPEGSSYNENGDGILFYQGSTDFGIRFPSVRQYTTAPTRFAKKGDILMSVRAPVGAVNIANADCCIGRGLSALNSKIGSLSHLYYLIDVFKTTFENKNAVGTTFGSITKDELYALPVTIPSKKVLEKFENIARPIFDKQMKIGEEIQHLTALRDELLPLLMNGQVKVENER